MTDIKLTIQDSTASRRRALVCEDDQIIRQMVATILEREKFVVDMAQDGEEAIRKIEANRYQLLVIDLMMPKVSGYDVVKYLKENLPPSLKRIVITTASTSALTNPFPEEICKVLAKPFEINEFITYARDCSEDTAVRHKKMWQIEEQPG